MWTFAIGGFVTHLIDIQVIFQVHFFVDMSHRYRWIDESRQAHILWGK